MRLRLIFAVAPVLAVMAGGCAPARPYRAPEPVVHKPVQNYVPVSAAKPVPVAPSSLGTYHTVMPKETVWRISQTYNVPMDTIIQVNNIKDHTDLKIGQVLFIPGVQTEPETLDPIPLPGEFGRWKYIVIHHTATYEGDKNSIHELHLRRGWKNGLGYHFLIDNGTKGKRDGEIEAGHRWYRQMNGAHANKSNMNRIGIGVSLVGNFSETQVSDKQMKSLQHLVRTLMKHYRIPKSRVIRHRDVSGAATECPGNDFPWSRFKASL